MSQWDLKVCRGVTICWFDFCELRSFLLVLSEPNFVLMIISVSVVKTPMNPGAKQTMELCCALNQDCPYGWIQAVRGCKMDKPVQGQQVAHTSDRS